VQDEGVVVRVSQDSRRQPHGEAELVQPLRYPAVDGDFVPGQAQGLQQVPRLLWPEGRRLQGYLQRMGRLKGTEYKDAVSIISANGFGSRELWNTWVDFAASLWDAVAERDPIYAKHAEGVVPTLRRSAGGACPTACGGVGQAPPAER